MSAFRRALNFLFIRNCLDMGCSQRRCGGRLHGSWVRPPPSWHCCVALWADRRVASLWADNHPNSARWKAAAAAVAAAAAPAVRWKQDPRGAATCSQAVGVRHACSAPHRHMHHIVQTGYTAAAPLCRSAAVQPLCRCVAVSLRLCACTATARRRQAAAAPPPPQRKVAVGPPAAVAAGMRMQLTHRRW